MRSPFRWVFWGIMLPAALCLASVLQARAVVALIEHGIGPPVARPAPAVPDCPSTPRAIDRAPVVRAFGAPPEVPRVPRPVAPPLLAGARVRLASRGLELRGVRSGSLLDAIGLAEGDVITRVNGVDARRPEAALLALTRLRNGGDFAIGVERGDRELVIRYHVR